MAERPRRRRHHDVTEIIPVISDEQSYDPDDPDEFHDLDPLDDAGDTSEPRDTQDTGEAGAIDDAAEAGDPEDAEPLEYPEDTETPSLSRTAKPTSRRTPAGPVASTRSARGFVLWPRRCSPRSGGFWGGWAAPPGSG